MRKLIAPLAVFAAVLVAMVALNDGATTPPALSAEGDARTSAARADKLLTRARETGDATLYARAERSVDAALRQDPDEVVALNAAATLAGLRHDFLGQLRYGRRAQRAEPDLASPLTSIFDGLIELGRYADAGRCAQRLVNLKPGLPAYARVSYYRELTGDPAGAASAMRFAAAAGGSPQSSAYVRALLGDLELARGRLGAARAAYRDALRNVPSFPQALTGLARLRAAGGDLDGAVVRLRRSTERLELTTSLTLLGETELAAGRARAGRRHLAQARAVHAADITGGGLPDAEAVLFEANHGSPARAVRLGTQVYRRAPSIRSADALGWALTRSGRAGAGHAWARRALRTGSRDPLFHLHAAVAARRVGLTELTGPHLAIARRGAAALSPLGRSLLER